MKKVNPFWHMFTMGVQLGGGLGGLYVVILCLIDGLLSPYVPHDQGGLMGLLPFLCVGGFVIGGIAGALLGSLDGLFLWFMRHKLQNPFAFLEKKGVIQLGIAILTTLGGFLLLFSTVLRGAQVYSPIGIFALLPPFIAGTAAVYASHRYFVELSPYDKQKEKQKNDDWQ